MKWISFRQVGGASSRGRMTGRSSWGVLDGDRVTDVGARLPAQPTLRSAIAADGLAAARAEANRGVTDFRLAEVLLEKPINDAEKIICVGVNYAERNDEYKDASDAPKYPSLFMRTPDSLVAHDEPILRPPESNQLDYEGELVIIVGKAGRRIAREQARQHIAGLTLMNEGTIRDWLRHGKFNVTQGKNFVGTGSLGPWMMDISAIGNLADLDIETRVNGELRQQDNTSRMMFPLDELIRYISQFMLLKPGDIIATGTPTGAGARFDPPRWLVPGDRIEIRSAAIGILANTVQDDPARG